MKTMPIVVILRGLPGSGKSSVADLFRTHYRISMDQFWVRDGREYKFDYSQLDEAIKWTQDQFLKALTLCGPLPQLIVVDNVNYAKDHFQFFVDEAKKVGANVYFVHIERTLDELKNHHNVPEEKVLEMAEKWEHIL
jgi:predicted kinase